MSRLPLPEPPLSRAADLTPLQIQAQLLAEHQAFADAATAYCLARDRYRAERRCYERMDPLFYRCWYALLGVAVLLRLLGNKPLGRALLLAMVATALLRGACHALRCQVDWRQLRRQLRHLAGCRRRMRPLERQLHEMEVIALVEEQGPDAGSGAPMPGNFR